MSEAVGWPAGVRTLDDWAGDRLEGRRILWRVDFNVPLTGTGLERRVADDTRIRQALPSLRWLTERGARVIAMTHLGRPRGPDPAFSVGPVAAALEALWGRPVPVVPALAEAPAAVAALGPGDALLLENLRFWPGEAANDPALAQALAALGDRYVNDAFGVAHRAHASVVGIPALRPGVAGRLMERELRALGQVVSNPPRPFWAVVGGAKVADKMRVFSRLVALCDGLVIGGGMANTFLAALGTAMGQSRIEPEALAIARDTLAAAERRGIPVLLPVDVVAARGFAPDAPHRVTPVAALAADEMALDIGPETVDRIRRALADAAGVFWNGPMGVFEWPAFAGGTLAVAQLLAELPAAVTVGGGDSVAAVRRAGLENRYAHVSTGGGAALTYLEGDPLPGVVALAQSPREERA